MILLCIVIFLVFKHPFLMQYSNMTNPIEIYLQQFDGLKLKNLQEMRIILQKALPEAEECISYGIPTYCMSAVLVYFAGNKDHVGFYPLSSGIGKFAFDPEDTNHSKGAIQFLYKKGLPKGLIRSIARTRRVKRELVKEVQAQSQSSQVKICQTPIMSQ